jgi:hypothetical protein
VTGVSADVVVVPLAPGPVVTPDAGPGGRDRDDFDELIDELLPDVDDPPGWFDAALIVGGATLAAWAIATHHPGGVVAAGVAALALGCILPLRAGWRGVRRRAQHRRHQHLLDQGVVIDVASPATARLVRAYGAVLSSTAGRPVPPEALAAAHGAVLEAATLLEGRVPASPVELRYVDERAAAVEGLGAVLRELAPATCGEPASEPPAVDRATLIAAREEVDEIAGSSSVSRIDDLARELRERHGG